MQSVRLSPLAQVEYAVKDLSYSMDFFTNVFREHEVEKAFSGVLTNPALDIRHSGFGKTVQQLCQPLMAGLPHSSAVQDLGNCVHNLCYIVDNIDAVVANCHEAGLGALIEFPLGDLWRQVLTEDNIRGNHQSYIFDTRAVFGFHLELAETPWQAEPQPPIMLPAYGLQWAQTGVDAGNTLRGINVVVEDLEHTLYILQSVFAGSVSLLHPPSRYNDGDAYSMVVELGEVRLVFIQPGSTGELARLLRVRGPGVHSLLADVADLAHAKQCLKKMGIKTTAPEPILLSALCDSELPEGEMLQVQSMTQLGVEFTLMCQASEDLLE